MKKTPVSDSHLQYLLPLDCQCKLNNKTQGLLFHKLILQRQSTLKVQFSLKLEDYPSLHFIVKTHRLQIPDVCTSNCICRVWMQKSLHNIIILHVRAQLLCV